MKVIKIFNIIKFILFAFIIYVCISNFNVTFAIPSPEDNASSTSNDSYTYTHTELKNQIRLLENQYPNLASTIYYSLSVADTGTTRPNRDLLSEDEYYDNMAKWAAVVLIPDIDRDDDVKENLSDLSGLDKRDITGRYYNQARDLIINAKDIYKNSINNGESEEDALNKAGEYVLQVTTEKAEQDVDDAKNHGVDPWGNKQDNSAETPTTSTNSTEDVEEKEVLTLDDIIKKGNDFLSVADDSMNTIDEKDLQNLSKFVSGVLLAIAIGITILTGVILGIKFITQSVEDKAKIKESMVPWIIGIMVSFGAFTIWEIAVNFFQSM